VFYRTHGDVRLVTWKHAGYYVQLLKTPHAIGGAAIAGLFALYLGARVRQRRRRHSLHRPKEGLG
jgi:hypothetical protein